VARVAAVPVRPLDDAPLPTDHDDAPRPAIPGVTDVRPVAGEDLEDGTKRGLRSELRRKVRERRRLRMIILLTVSVVILGALPLFFGVRAAMRDPVFAALDDLDVPPAVAADVDDRSAGSRWCFLECLFRERTARSSESPEVTNQSYVAALDKAGWQRWNVEGCPEAPVDGTYTCWRRDEFTLDLWVRAPACPEPVPVDGKLPEPAAECLGATVSIKVRNAIADERGRGPEPTPAPGQVGETPEAVPTVDPLRGATPSPS
jgi:integrin beta 3